jgi:predicted P-loop ATPase
MNAAVPIKRQAGPPDWRSDLAQRGGRIIGDERNVIDALRQAPDLQNLVRFDLFRQVVEFGRPPPWRQVKLGDRWTEDDDLKLQAWLQEQGVDARHRGVVADCVRIVSKEWAVHPVRGYLQSLAWDNTPRLQLWLVDYLGATGPPDYLAAVGRKFLISAVARVMDPGCQVDHVLTLEGPQGIGKSRTVQILGEPWTCDGLPDLHSKEAAIYLSGAWIVEIAELAAERRSQIEATKSFLTRREDRYRPPYGRVTVDVPRQNVFMATTNESTYLRDLTGNRRFWCVKCSRIDLDALARDRDQLWAEALKQFEIGSMWHLTSEESAMAEDEQRERLQVSELEHDVGQYLEGLRQAGQREVNVRDVLVFGLKLDPDKADYQERAAKLGAKVATAMERIGWRKVKREGRGEKRRTVYRLSQESPSESGK